LLQRQAGRRPGINGYCPLAGLEIHSGYQTISKSVATRLGIGQD
jgi:hypothetical protein